MRMDGQRSRRYGRAAIGADHQPHAEADNPRAERRIQKQAVAALYVISSILGLSAVVLTSSGAIKAMLFLMALAVAAFLASRVIFRRDIDKALQAEKAAAEEKNTETATPAETVPTEPEEESNEEKKEGA